MNRVFDEDEFLELLVARLAASPRRDEVVLGVGDDAAILRSSSDAVIATDLLLEGIDFRVAECGFARAGKKAMNKNFSDLAAMGALPVAAFVSVALPAGITREDATALIDGLCAAAERASCEIAGGDTKRSPSGLVVNVLVVGRLEGGSPLRRDGAKVGDVLMVTGALGGSSRSHHLDFEPRLASGVAFARLGATAAIDLSDGLARDLPRLCRASGVGALLDADSIPVTDQARELAVTTGRTPLDHALSDGEDYEILATLPPERIAAALTDPALRGTRVVGEIVAAAAGIQLRRDGTLAPLPRGGFRHRFDRGGG